MKNKVLFTITMVAILITGLFGCDLVNNDADKEILKNAHDALAITYQDGGSIVDNKVTKDVQLLSRLEGVNITWETSDSDVIDLEGNVTRGQEDKEVTLTANLKYKSLKEQKPFVLTVLKEETGGITTDEILEEAYDLLELSDVGAVTEDIVFVDAILALEETVNITWESQSAEIISNEGVVNRPLLDEEVTVIATLEFDNETKTKTFVLTVIGTFETSLILDHVSNKADNKTNDTLPNVIEGISVEWSSSNPAYAIKDGVGSVVKQYQSHQNKTATITASLEFPNSSTRVVTKTITIAPVLFENLPDSPVATYFSTSVTSSYKTHSERYKNEGTLFSESTKEVLNILYYAFARISEDATVRIENTAQINEVMHLKNNDVRVVLCISGVSYAESVAFANITASDSLRATFVTNIMNLIDNNNFDGVDIDWESVTGAYVIESGLTALLKDLRAEMTKRQATGGTPYYLSVCVPASSWGLVTTRYNFPVIKNYVDYINLMSYDMNNGTKTTHLAPLYISSNDGGYGFGVDYGVKRMVSMGLPASQIIIGGAGYGKAYRVTTTGSGSYPALGQTGALTQISGVSGSYASGTLFGNGIQELIKSGRYTVHHEYNTSGNFVGSYLYSTTDNIFVTYDSAEAIGQKYNYIGASKGQGMMFWCYGEDPSDIILDTIYAKWQAKK